MKSPIDIDGLLRQAASKTPEKLNPDAEEIKASIVQFSRQVDPQNYVIVAGYFFLAFGACLFLMVAMAIAWWKIAISFSASGVLTMIAASLVKRILPDRLR